MNKTAHITIAGQPFCGWLGCAAGQDTAKRVQTANTGSDLPAITCGHDTIKNARRVAQALRPHFRAGAVAVVAGYCPDSGLAA